MLGKPKLSRRDSRNEHGATLVEFTLVFIIVITFMFMLIEFAALVFDQVTIARSSKEAVAVTTELGSEQFADYQGLQEINNSLNGLHPDQIEQIIIYKVYIPTDHQVPSQCLLGSVHDICNTYTSAALTADKSAFGCGDPTKLDDAYCPSSRHDTVDYNPTSGAVAGTDTIGVYIRYKHNTLTGFLRSITFSRSATARVEAQRYGDS